MGCIVRAGGVNETESNASHDASNGTRRSVIATQARVGSVVLTYSSKAPPTGPGARYLGYTPAGLARPVDKRGAKPPPKGQACCV